MKRVGLTGCLLMTLAACDGSDHTTGPLHTPDAARRRRGTAVHRPQSRHAGW